MIRHILRFAVEKPIINHIFFVFTLLLSIFAYQNIPKEIFPPATLDRIAVTGSYVGASADVMDKMVVEALEEELGKIPQIDTVETVIQNGTFLITSDIKSGEDRLIVLSDVKDAIAKIKQDLPADMNEPVAQIKVHQYPLLLIAVSGDKTKSELIDAAREVKRRLSRLQDISDIDIRGEADREVRIVLDTDKLHAYGISEDAFLRALQSISAIYPIGTVDKKGEHVYLSTLNGLKSAEAYRQIVLKIGMRRIRLGDVAQVTMGLGESDQLSHFNAKENISLNVNKTKQGNAIALSREIKKILREEISPKYPDIIFKVHTDTSIWIKNRLNLVTSNIFFGLLLVFAALVLSVNMRIAFVVAIGIPTSFMIALIVVDAIDYSLNMLTLLGGLIALGMLVDEAIVVAENIYRHLEAGKTPKEAAIDGAAEMFPAVLTATMTTVFAFLPLLIMSGKMGMFMQVLPTVITVLLLSSLFEAFYFLPLHAKEIFSGATARSKQRGRIWVLLGRVYGYSLEILLRYKKSALTLIVTSIVMATFAILEVTKFQLFPEFDTQQIYLTGKVDIENKLEDTETYVRRMEEAILKIAKEHETDSVTSVIGIRFNTDMSFETGEHLFHIFINLHERAPSNIFDRYINPIFAIEYDDSDMIRYRSAQQIATQIRNEIVKPFRELREEGKPIYHELTVYVPQTGIVGHDIEVGIGGKSEAETLRALEKLKHYLSSIDGAYGIYDNADEGLRELKLRINDYGQQLGFSEGYLVSVLKGAFLRAQYSKMFDQSGMVRIKVESLHKKHGGDLKAYQIATPDGKGYVALGEIADFIYQRSYLKIYKEDGVRLFSVFAKIDKSRITPTEAMERLFPFLEQLRKDGFHIVVRGEQSQNAQVRKEMTQAALMAIFLIFLALVWMFDALLLPLIVLSTIPLSILGALIGTKLMGINLTLPGIMGLIGLAGVVVNDGLIMLDFIKKSHTIHDITKQALLRLRPIVLTSVTTVLGLSSLIFFASGQALILQPMAISLGFGVAWATLLNLFYVPVLFAVLYRIGSQK